MRHSPARAASAIVAASIIFGAICVAPAAIDSVETATTTPRITVRGTETREFDWAKLQARASIAYVSSGPRILASRMIDNDLQTAFAFSSADEAPMVIVALAQNTQLHRVTATFKAEAAELSIYLLNDLPKKAADLGSATPIATIVDLPSPHGNATVSFSASNARYVVLRWKRNKWQEPFTVAEISAFSNDPAELISDRQLAAIEGPTLATTEPPPLPVVSP